MAGFDAGRIEASLDLDRSPFQRKLEQTKRDARDFADGRYATTLDADTKSADAKILDLRTKLDRLSVERVTPKVDLEGVTEASVRVAALQTQLDRLDRTAGGSGRGGILGRLASFGQGGFFGGTGLLGVAGGSALVPFGVAGAGLAASFLTPTVAGAAGLGLFGAASHASLTRVEAARKQLDALDRRIANTSSTNAAGTPQQIAAAQARLTAAQARLSAVQRSDTSTPASVASAQASVVSAQSSLTNAQGGGANAEHAKLVHQRQQLLSTLTPAERAAAQGIDQLDEAWKRFQRALEPQTFRLLATGTDILQKGLHALLPMTRAVGDEVDHLAKRADTALSQPFWQHFFGDFLTREAPRAVDTLGTVLGNVITGFAHLAEDFAPLGHQLEDNVIRWSGMFDKWTQGSGPQKFVALVEKDGPIAAKALEALAHGLGGLVTGLEPIGRIGLQALTPVLQFIGDLGRQHPEVITALGVAYLSVAGGLKAISAVDSIKRTLDGASGGLVGLRRGALLTAGALGAFGIGSATSGPTGAGDATLAGALTGLIAGLAAGGPWGAALGAAGGALAGLAGHFLNTRHEVNKTKAALQEMESELANVLKLDKGVAGANVRGFINDYLKQHPDFTHQLAGAGVTSNDLFRYITTGSQSGPLAGLINLASQDPQRVYDLDRDPATGRVMHKAQDDAEVRQIEAAKQIVTLLTAFKAAMKEATDYLDVTTGRRHAGRAHAGQSSGGAFVGHPASQHHGGAVYNYDLRGSHFTGVSNPQDLERKLSAKQRQAALSQGPGERRIGFDR